MESDKIDLLDQYFHSNKKRRTWLETYFEEFFGDFLYEIELEDFNNIFFSYSDLYELDYSDEFLQEVTYDLLRFLDELNEQDF